MPAMRMPRKAGEVVVRVVVAEIVEQQERIELGRVAEPEGAPQLHAGAFDCGFRLHTCLIGRTDMMGAPYSMRVGSHPHALSLGAFAPRSGRRRFIARASRVTPARSPESAG